MPKIGMSELAPALEWPKYFYQGFNRQYFRKVLAIDPSNLIAYWPLWEASGAVAYDYSGNGLHGAYLNTTPAQIGIGDGRSSVFFEGAFSTCNVYSAGLNTAWDQAEATILLWFQITIAAVWADLSWRRFLNLTVDVNNRVRILRTGTENQIKLEITSDGTTNTIMALPGPSASWICLVGKISESGDELELLLDDVSQGTDSGLGAWAGNLDSTLANIGAENTAGATCHKGQLAHMALWNGVLSSAKTSALALR